MRNKVSNKLKIILLGIATLIVAYIIYNIAIIETIEIKRQLDNNIEQLNQMSNAKKQIKQLTRELARINQDFTSADVDQSKFREYVLEKINNSISKMDYVKLIEIPQEHCFRKNNYDIYTYSLLLEGDFFQLQRLVYSWETGFLKKKIRSVSYYTKVDNKTGAESLMFKIYIQNIIHNEDH